MKTLALLYALDGLDREQQTWLVTTAMLRDMFPEESGAALQASLRRHVAGGLLRRVCRGLYANERARAMPRFDRLHALVPLLRPGVLNYISQETRLAELGLISQVPIGCLMVMTRGASGRLCTGYGTVQFTHTVQPPAFLLAHTQRNPEHHLLEADATLALRDLRRARRCWDLVEEQAAKEAA